eukprot:GEMP01022439.1.p1 GENE.GEMP01022439.1~~GEMP01022439.1.p1  ORF type:complete len:634 (+),score=188.19 GEMP01022439.1:177-2078(+)
MLPLELRELLRVVPNVCPDDYKHSNGQYDVEKIVLDWSVAKPYTTAALPNPQSPSAEPTVADARAKKGPFIDSSGRKGAAPSKGRQPVEERMNSMNREDEGTGHVAVAKSGSRPTRWGSPDVPSGVRPREFSSANFRDEEVPEPSSPKSDVAGLRQGGEAEGDNEDPPLDLFAVPSDIVMGIIEEGMKDPSFSMPLDRYLDDLGVPANCRQAADIPFYDVIKFLEDNYSKFDGETWFTWPGKPPVKRKAKRRALSPEHAPGGASASRRKRSRSMPMAPAAKGARVQNMGKPAQRRSRSMKRRSRSRSASRRNRGLRVNNRSRNRSRSRGRRDRDEGGKGGKRSAASGSAEDCGDWSDGGKGMWEEMWNWMMTKGWGKGGGKDDWGGGKGDDGGKGKGGKDDDGGKGKGGNGDDWGKGKGGKGDDGGKGRGGNEDDGWKRKSGAKDDDWGKWNIGKDDDRGKDAYRSGKGREDMGRQGKGEDRDGKGKGRDRSSGRDERGGRDARDASGKGKGRRDERDNGADDGIRKGKGDRRKDDEASRHSSPSNDAEVQEMLSMFGEWTANELGQLVDEGCSQVQLFNNAWRQFVRKDGNGLSDPRASMHSDLMKFLKREIKHCMEDVWLQDYINQKQCRG